FAGASGSGSARWKYGMYLPAGWSQLIFPSSASMPMASVVNDLVQLAIGNRVSPVTADTLFPIASCTKSFTTLAMGMLADEGKMSWDHPAGKYIPYFHLADPLPDAPAN